MTKHVFTNSQCAHVWAQQSQDWGKGASVSFDGPAFKSYFTVIARFVDTALGGKAVLFSDRRYSPTTNRHMSHARNAVCSVPVFTVPTIDGTGWDHNGPVDHARNLAALVTNFNRAGESYMRVSADRYGLDNFHYVQESVLGLANTANDYARHFGLAAPRFVDHPMSVLNQIRKRLETLHSTPERAARAQRRAFEEAARLQEKIANDNIARQDWIAGGLTNSRYRHVVCEQGGALLRVTGDKVVTSWGAECPLDHAKRAFAFYRAVMLRNVAPWHRSELAHRGDVTLGHFQLDSIDAAGNVKAGCHTIYRAELERVAKELES